MKNLMYYNSLGMVCVICLVFSSAAAAQKASMNTPPAVPAHWMAIEEDIWTVFSGETLQEFHLARVDFFNKNMKAVAVHLRRAIAFMKLETGAAAPEEAKEPLLVSIRELRKLTHKVVERSVASVRLLDHVFAHADYALAQYHLIKALEFLGKMDGTRAGHHLKEAALRLESGLAAAGHEATLEEQTAMRNTVRLAEILVTGTTPTVEEVKISRAIRALGKGIKHLGDIVAHEHLARALQ